MHNILSSPLYWSYPISWVIILQSQYPLLQQLWKITEKCLMKISKYIPFQILAWCILRSFYCLSAQTRALLFPTIISISCLVGFHGLNIPFYYCILFTVLLNKSLPICSSGFQPTTKPFVGCFGLTRVLL
jgi:hypothetical protein